MTVIRRQPDLRGLDVGGRQEACRREDVQRGRARVVRHLPHAEDHAGTPRASSTER